VTITDAFVLLAVRRFFIGSPRLLMGVTGLAAAHLIPAILPRAPR